MEGNSNTHFSQFYVAVLYKLFSFFRCYHCSFITKHQQKFERHLRIKHEQSTPKAEPTHNHNSKLEPLSKMKFINTNLSVNMTHKFHQKECSTLQCQFCEITKTDDSNLRIHYYAVHNHCLECQTTLESRTATLNHVKTVKHEDKTKKLIDFKCNICACIKSNQADLEKHCYAMHNHCFECQLSFNSKSAALNHMKTVHEAKNLPKDLLVKRSQNLQNCQIYQGELYLTKH